MKNAGHSRPAFFENPDDRMLFSEVKGLDDGTITFDINFDQVVEETTSLTYESQQCTLGVVVVLVSLEVTCEVVDTVGK